MGYTAEDVLEFVYENDVKFIRLAFCDLFGIQKNISVIVNQFEKVLKEGIFFDGSAIPGFGSTHTSDLLLCPDPATLAILPWRPQQGRVVRLLCNINNSDNTPFAYDTRNVLKKTIADCEALGYTCQIGVESEFYLFQLDENGYPTTNTHDEGGYFDIAPLDRGENVRREICLSLEEMGLEPETSHHERGPGQHEIDFKCSNALTAADNFITFKAVVKAIASRNGLFASFMPKPIANKNGSSLRTKISLLKNGVTVFKNTNSEQSEITNSFIAGMLSKAAEITAFLNPTTNSYKRFASAEAPELISWSHQNRTSLIRISDVSSGKPWIELCSPDPSINPYLAFSLILSAGLDGVENHMKLSLPCDTFPPVSAITSLPQNLNAAIQLSEKSSFVKKTIGSDIFRSYIEAKKMEESEFQQANDAETFYSERYFKIL